MYSRSGAGRRARMGVRVDEIEAGLALAPHAIALDAGSTDSGPAYLATAAPVVHSAALAKSCPPGTNWDTIKQACV